jgi:transposase
MPTKRVSMQNIREILRLKYGVGLSHEQIRGALGLSKSVVTKYIGLANEQTLSWPLPAELDDDDALQARLVPPKPVASGKAQLDYDYIHKELGRNGVTLQLLWEEYAAAQGVMAYKYSRYCDLYRQWYGRQKRSMHQRHIAGEKLFIDYSGPTVDVINQATGEIRTAQIFVAVLGGSSYTYAEATWSQGLADWIASHVRTFEFMGGVTKLLIPDNLRSAITKACRYDPRPNDTYADLARHYDTAILPARPYKPQDKAKAEVGVLVVQRWILARLRHQQFFSLRELNQAIARLLPELNDRIMKQYGQSRRERFEAIDKPALRPLPKSRYEYAEHKVAKVAIDYHIEVNKRLYSVPHQLVGSKVDIRVSSSMVQINHKGKQVALHQRHGPGRFSTCVEHMPKSHRKHAEWTPSRFLSWAQSIGPATHTVVEFQLTDRPHPEHGYRACLGILNLARRYSKSRLEDACIHAVKNRSMYYDSLTSILKKGLDQQTLPGMEITNEDPLPAHDNVRGADYYT